MTETHLPATRRGPGSGHDGPRLAGGRHLPQPRPIPGAAAGRPQQGPSGWATAPGRPQPWCHRAAPAGASAAGTRRPACGVTTGPATTMHPHVFRWGGDGPVTHVLPTTWNRPASPADEGPALPSGPRPGRARGHSWTPMCHLHPNCSRGSRLVTQGGTRACSPMSLSILEGGGRAEDTRGPASRGGGRAQCGSTWPPRPCFPRSQGEPCTAPPVVTPQVSREEGARKRRHRQPGTWRDAAHQALGTNGSKRSSRDTPGGLARVTGRSDPRPPQVRATLRPLSSPAGPRTLRAEWPLPGLCPGDVSTCDLCPHGHTHGTSTITTRRRQEPPPCPPPGARTGDQGPSTRRTPRGRAEGRRHGLQQHEPRRRAAERPDTQGRVARGSVLRNVRHRQTHADGWAAARGGWGWE